MESPASPPPRSYAGRFFTALHRWAASGWAGPATGTWVFFQSALIPGPSDVLYLPLALAEPKRAPILGTWSAAGAVLGGIVAYVLGALFFHIAGTTLLDLVGVTVEEFAKFEAYFARYGWLVIAVGALPLMSPKIIAIAAGAFSFPLGLFILVIALTRGLRFIAMGFLIRSVWMQRLIYRMFPFLRPASLQSLS